MAGRTRPAAGRGTVKRPPGQVKTHHPKGTRCEGEGCTAFISIYNDDTVCATCYEKIDITDLPTKIGRYL